MRYALQAGKLTVADLTNVRPAARTLPYRGDEPSPGTKRRDVSIHRTSAGGLHIDVEMPATLAGSVGNLLAALGVKASR